MKKLVSWNVNGIRAVFKKGFVQYLNKELPNIICLQEIKAEKDQFPTEILEHEKYHVYISSAQKKGYSGVCIMTQEKPIEVISDIGIDKFDSEGRVLIAIYKTYVVINCYFPNGQRDHARVDYKLEFYDEILKIYNDFRAKKKHVYITGDFNTSHHEIDLANPKANIKSTGFLPREREYMDKYINEGMIDTFRHFYPDKTGEYTWWTYRNDCRGRNIGWRLDYFMTNKSNIKNVIDCTHRPDIHGSDHCPIEITVKN